ncbi:MAG: hypothetical protein GF313_05260 [Caldithrix sp.]|nr:hypothetical protein [Caldithrix sp.]
MKILRLILLVFLTIIILGLIVAAFLPSDYHIERQTTIQAPVDSVYSAVFDLNQWIYWNPWTTMDTTAQYDFTGQGEGAYWEWDGEMLGQGRITIVEYDANRMIRNELVFEEPQHMVADDIWYFKVTPAGTQVTWAQEGELNYPIGRFLGLFLDDMIGPDFEKGLHNLKNYVEENAYKDNASG